jgi:hypothetical protein
LYILFSNGICFYLKTSLIEIVIELIFIINGKK